MILNKVEPEAERKLSRCSKTTGQEACTSFVFMQHIRKVIHMECISTNEGGSPAHNGRALTHPAVCRSHTVCTFSPGTRAQSAQQVPRAPSKSATSSFPTVPPVTPFHTASHCLKPSGTAGPLVLPQLTGQEAAPDDRVGGGWGGRLSSYSLHTLETRDKHLLSAANVAAANVLAK